jgi:hypothetical protein
LADIRAARFYDGAQIVELRLQRALALRGIAANTFDFVWHRGQPLPPIPEQVTFEIGIQGFPPQQVVFHREQIEDCSSQMRKDVYQTIWALANALHQRPSA